MIKGLAWPQRWKSWVDWDGAGRELPEGSCSRGLGSCMGWGEMSLLSLPTQGWSWQAGIKGSFLHCVVKRWLSVSQSWDAGMVPGSVSEQIHERRHH